MLLTEWNWDDAISVRCEEAREEKALEIARKMKELGEPIEKIQIFTGLSTEVIQQISQAKFHLPQPNVRYL